MIVTECVHAYSSAFVNTAGDSAWHTVAMDSEVVDSNGYHDPGANERLTFASGGVFLICAGLQMANPGGSVFGRITVNGSQVGLDNIADGNAATPTQVCGTTHFWLDDFAAGDFVAPEIKNTAGGIKSAKAQICAVGVSDWSCLVQGSGSAVPLEFQTTHYDPHGMVTSQTTITAQKDGYYLCLLQFTGVGPVGFRKNGSGSPLNGSREYTGTTFTYTVERFSVGDTLSTGGTTINPGSHYLAMVYLGNVNACLAHTYNSTDFVNTFLPPAGTLETDSEWIDRCSGHPKSGNDGEFYMTAGYHFALAKISTDGGTFLQNDAVYTLLNGVQMATIFSTNRHQQGDPPCESVGFACFQAAEGDTFSASWQASTLFAASAFTPTTNVFVTDAGVGGGTSQIYRRL